MQQMLHAAAAARATLLQASFLNVKLGLGIRNTQGSQHYRGSKSIIKLTSGFGDRKCKILEVQKQDKTGLLRWLTFVGLE